MASVGDTARTSNRRRLLATDENLSNVYSRQRAPIATVAPGEVFEVETQDCFGGRLRDPSGLTAENQAWIIDNENILTGPISVQGARPGDVIAVTVHGLEITTPGSVRYSRMESLSAHDWWEEQYGCRGLPVSDGTIHVSDDISIPIRPLIGCIGTAPRVEIVRATREGTYGGNLDCREITTGATVILPVEVEGGLLYLGDCKAAMGSGEIIQAPEAGTLLTLSVEVRRSPANMTWPRVETADKIMVLASASDATVAARTAFRDLLLWTEEETGSDRETIGIVMGMVADTVICQVSNTLHTVHCEMPRWALAKLRSASRP